jgi:hypothetical protein
MPFALHLETIWRPRAEKGRANTASASMTGGAYVLIGMREMHMMSKSSIITSKREDPTIEEKMPVIRPGEILKEDFMMISR